MPATRRADATALTVLRRRPDRPVTVPCCCCGRSCCCVLSQSRVPCWAGARIDAAPPMAGGVSNGTQRVPPEMQRPHNGPASSLRPWFAPRDLGDAARRISEPARGLDQIRSSFGLPRPMCPHHRTPPGHQPAHATFACGCSAQHRLGEAWSCGPRWHLLRPEAGRGGPTWTRLLPAPGTVTAGDGGTGCGPSGMSGAACDLRSRS